MNIETYLRSTLPPEQQLEWDRLASKEAAVTPAGAFSRIGAPALAGAGVGALHGAIHDTLDAREQGQTWGQSLRQGARGALRTGAKGLGVGAAVGAVSPAMGGRLVDYGKGVAHSLTGWVPKGGLDSLNAGSALVKKQIANATKDGVDPEQIKRMHAQLGAMTNLETKNLTHLPGLAKGLVTHPVDTVHAAGRYLVDGTTGLDKAMLAGMTGLGMVPIALDDQRTTGEKATLMARQAGGMLLGAPLGAMTTQGNANMGALGMVENMAHNVFSSGSGRLLVDAPITEAERALRSKDQGATALDGVSRGIYGSHRLGATHGYGG